MGPRSFSGEGIVRFYPVGARRRPGFSYRAIGDLVGVLVGVAVTLVLCLGLSAAFGAVGLIGGGMISFALFYPILLISRIAWPLSLLAATLAAVALVGLGHLEVGNPGGQATAAATVARPR
jgi:hypothetical protein